MEPRDRLAEPRQNIKRLAEVSASVATRIGNFCQRLQISAPAVTTTFSAALLDEVLLVAAGSQLRDSDALPRSGLLK